jgi:cytochrome c-type biogenesis protein CcmH
MIAFSGAAALLAAGVLMLVLPPLIGGERADRRLAVALALAVPLAASGLYYVAGTPSALAPEAPASDARHALTPERIQAMVGRLAERLRENPQDGEGWAMLARSYAALGRFQDSVLAFERAAERAPRDARLLADYADVAAMAQGKRLLGRPEVLIARALEADPNNVKALSLAGTAALEKGDYEGARAMWQRILPLVPPDSAVARSVRGSLAEAERRAAR